MNDLPAQVGSGSGASETGVAGVSLLYPEFDPVTEKWFLIKPMRCESDSLRGLLERLHRAGHDAQFAGYFPVGTHFRYDWGTVVNDRRDDADKRALELAREAVRREPKVKRPSVERIPGMYGQRRTFDREAILNMWFANIPTEEISRITGASSATIFNTLQLARYNADPRAIRRQAKRKKPITQSITEGMTA